MKPRPLLNRQGAIKRIKRDLAIARRKMEQILTYQVNNKLTTIQVANLSDIMGAGTVFLKNLIKEISGKNVLTFIPSPDHKGSELPQFNWVRANKLLPENTEEQKRHNDMRIKAESIAVLQRMRTETHKSMMARERRLAGTKTKGKVELFSSEFF